MSGDPTPGLPRPQHTTNGTELMVQIAAHKSCHQVHSSLSETSGVRSQSGAAWQTNLSSAKIKLERVAHIQWKRASAHQPEESLSQFCAYASELNWPLIMYLKAKGHATQSPLITKDNFEFR